MKGDSRPRIPTARATGASASPQAKLVLMPLTSVAVACRSFPRVVAIWDVIERIDRFVGAGSKWTVFTACDAGLPGEMRLLRRLAAREDLNMDPLLKRDLFSDRLHSAIERDNLEVIKWLVEEYLPTGRIRDELEEAASRGQLHTIRWLWEYHRSRVVWTSILVSNAAKHDHLELAKWLHVETWLNASDAKEMIKTSAICNGNVAMLEWAIELGAYIRTADFQVAERNGHVHILERIASVRSVRVTQSLVPAAARGGHLEVVKWLVKQTSVKLTVSARDLQCAPAPLLSWVLEYMEVEHKESLAKGIDAAASRSDLELVKLLHENSNGGTCTTAAMDEAANAGHLETVKWVHENRSEGCTTKAMGGAASGGHLDVVEWLHENRSEGCTTEAMDGAAEHGHLEIVKWLHAHRTEGCTTDAMDSAASCGHLEMVKWLHSNTHEGCTTAAMDAAAMNGHLDVAQWLHDNRNEGCTTAAMNDAAMNGCLDVVRWLHENRSEGCTTNAMDQAACWGHLEVLQWLHEHRAEGCSERAMTRATDEWKIQGLRWLVANGLAQVTWEVVIYLVCHDQLDAVEWMLPRLQGKFIVDQVTCICSLEMAQLLHSDGRFPVGPEHIRFAMEFSDWQLSQWLIREYPDAMLNPIELEKLVREQGDEMKVHSFRAYMQDAICELEQLRKG